MTKFYFLRHADARTGDIRHTKESPLTELGRLQANNTGQYFKSHLFGGCVGSPAKRVQETLSIISDYTPTFINTWQILREIARSVDGMSYEESLEYSQLRREAIIAKNAKWKYVNTDESFLQIKERAIEIKYDLIKEFKGQICLVGGHSQVFSMLHTVFYFGDKPTNDQLFIGFNRYFLKPAAFSEVIWSPKRGWKIISFNKYQHLSDPEAD